MLWVLMSGCLCFLSLSDRQLPQGPQCCFWAHNPATASINSHFRCTCGLLPSSCSGEYISSPACLWSRSGCVGQSAGCCQLFGSWSLSMTLPIVWPHPVPRCHPHTAPSAIGRVVLLTSALHFHPDSPACLLLFYHSFPQTPDYFSVSLPGWFRSFWLVL